MRLELILLVLAVSGCICCGPGDGDGLLQSTTTVKSKVTSTTLLTETTQPSIPKDRVSCEAAGGRWGRIGISPREACNLPASDGGADCSDGSECEGACLAELTPQQMESLRKGGSVEAAGKCTPWRITVGCQARVEDGKARMLCVD